MRNSYVNHAKISREMSLSGWFSMEKEEIEKEKKAFFLMSDNNESFLRIQLFSTSSPAKGTLIFQGMIASNDHSFQTGNLT